MPNIKSAKKRLLTSEKSRVANQAVRTQVKSQRSKFMDVITSNDKTASTDAFKSYCSILDKAAKKGVIKKNTAVRRKRRASKKVSAIA